MTRSGTMRWTTAALACALALSAAEAAAQDQKVPWKDNLYPYLSSQANDFPVFVIHYDQNRAADYFDRTTYSGRFSVDAGASTHGSRFALVRFHAPLLWKDWRLLGTALTGRSARFGYYGLGNDTDYDEDLEGDSQPFYYRARRTRYLGEVEVSRRITGPLHVAGAGAIEHSNMSDLPQPSIFRTDWGDDDLTDTDARGRLGLVLDLRDNEFNTTRGLFAQAWVGHGSGGDGYTRISADLRGFVAIREGTVLTARLGGSHMDQEAPLNARFQVPLWETELSVLGGVTSNRGLPFQRFAGQGVLFTGAELRHDLLNLGDLGAFTLFGFADAGRVFEGEDFRLTTEDLSGGGGGGLAIRILRTFIWTFNFGGGPDGFQFSTWSGWSW
ncbi:MAG: BamA/TamA family outer membrane protein [Gemmatimonadota bacterium]|nr:BamA/TamA family outer membrane protein [Gemmatimonadota bacterium]